MSAISVQAEAVLAASDSDLVVATLDMVGFATSSDAPGDLQRRAAMLAQVLCDADVAMVVNLPVGDRDRAPIPAVVTVAAAGLAVGTAPDLASPELAALVHAGEPAEARDGPSSTVSSAGDVAPGPWTLPSPAFGTLADGRPLRAFLAAPAMAAAGFQRATVVVGSASSTALGPVQARRLAAMAAWLGPALDVRLRLTRSGRVAEALQAPLLPPLPPDLPHLDVAARYRAADDSGRVGGDFYDMHPTSAGEWRVVIGDVCGTGPEAAAVTGIARYTLRATAVTDPADALATLNSSILEHTRDHRFLTAVCLSLRAAPDGVSGLMCCAGHPSPLIVRADGTVEETAFTGSTLLGVFEDPLLSDERFTLAPGDALVLYTDGVTEAREAGGEQFGEERLAKLLASCAGRTADGIARRIELAARDHLGSQQHDDMAIVVLRATGAA